MSGTPKTKTRQWRWATLFPPAWPGANDAVCLAEVLGSRCRRCDQATRRRPQAKSRGTAAAAMASSHCGLVAFVGDGDCRGLARDPDRWCALILFLAVIPLTIFFLLAALVNLQELSESVLPVLMTEYPMWCDNHALCIDPFYNMVWQMGMGSVTSAYVRTLFFAFIFSVCNNISLQPAQRDHHRTHAAVPVLWKHLCDAVFFHLTQIVVQSRVLVPPPRESSAR